VSVIASVFPIGVAGLVAKDRKYNCGGVASATPLTIIKESL